MKTSALALAATLLATSFASPAFADRQANKAERQQVSKVLRAHGFVSWGKIERDDGKWEVDNAVTASGKVYDIDIRGGRIVEWDRD